MSPLLHSPAWLDRFFNKLLAISERDGCVLVHCFAGCTQAEVIEALRARGLWPQAKREWLPEPEYRAKIERRRRAEWLAEMALLWRAGAMVELEREQAMALEAALQASERGDSEASERWWLSWAEAAHTLGAIRQLAAGRLVERFIYEIRVRPAETRRLIRAARDDERHAWQVTAALVALLAEAQRREVPDAR